MKNKSYFLLGGLGMALLLFLILGAAAPAPVQRNQWSTNVPGQAVHGTTLFDANMTVGQVLISASLITPQIQFNLGVVGDAGWDTGTGVALAARNTTVTGWYTQTGTGSTNISTVLGRAPLSLFGSTNGFFFPTNAADGKVWTCDAVGNGRWITPAAPTLSETTLAYSASTVTLDFSSTIYQFLVVTNDTTITNLNQAAVKNVVLSMIGNNTNCNLTFPANWQFLGAGAPALLASNKWGVLSLTARGTSPTNIIAAYSAQP